MGECINVMIQALQAKYGTLPLGLTVQNTYTELRKGNKKTAVMVHNSTAYPQIIRKKPCGQGGSCIASARTPKSEGLQEGIGESADFHTPNLTVWQRHGKLFDELDLSGLDSWTPELADAAHQLLAEYYDVFSLDPAELGCTHSTEHIIKVTYNTPLRNGSDEFHHHWLRRLGII